MRYDQDVLEHTKGDDPTDVASLALALIRLNRELVNAQKIQYACLLGGPAVSYHRTVLKEFPWGWRSLLSEALYDWGLNFQRLYYMDKARVAIDEAVETKRLRYVKKPDRHRQRLVDFYDAQSGLYFNSRDTAAAERVLRDAIPLCREMARQDYQFVALAGRAYRDHGLYLTTLVRFTEACVEFEEALKRLRPIYNQDPTNSDYTLWLALTLYHYADCLVGIFRFDDALAAIEESIVLYEKRYMGTELPRPKTQFKFEYTQAVLRKGGTLAVMQRYDEACEMDVQAISGYREAHAENPNNYRGMQIAQSLANYGDHLWAAEKFEEAFDAFRQSVIASDAFTEDVQARYLRNPDSWAAEMALAHNQKKIALLRLQAFPEIIHTTEQCVSVLRETIPRVSSHFTIDMAFYLREHGVALYRTRRFEESCEAFEEAAKINRALNGLNPNHHDYNLAVTLYEYSNTLGALTRYEDGCAAGAESIELIRKLYVGNPNRNRVALAQALARHAEYLGILQRYPEACRAIMEALDHYRERYATHKVAIASEHAIGLTTAGNLLLSAQREAEAQKIFQEAVNVFEEASVVERSRIILKCDEKRRASDFTLVQRRYGWCLFQIGRFSEGLHAIREAAQVLLPLYEEDPKAHQENFARLQVAIAQCSFALQQYEDACKGSSTSIHIYQQLDKESSGQYGEFVSFSMWSLARSYERLDQPAAALEVLKEEKGLRRPFRTSAYPRLANDIKQLSETLLIV